MLIDIEREQIEFDVLFIGGGPASLASAIRLLQLAKARNMEIQAALIEKAAEIGGHSLSGAVMNPLALKRLLPEAQLAGFPMEALVRDDALYFLTRKQHFKIPVLPKYLHNQGFPIISLARFTKWLAGIAEELGLNIFPGFTAERCLFDESQIRVQGVITGDKGLNKEGLPKQNAEPGLNIISKITVFGEGARGSLFKEVADKLGLSRGKLPQVYETGIKEVIQLPEKNRFQQQRENCVHTLGYPLKLNVPGGGFLYEMKDNKISMGFLTGLAYSDPSLDLYELFREFKRHPFIAGLIEGGEVIEQGARSASSGGYYTIPKLAFNGGMVIGASAAIQNSSALKGIHVAMESGMLAAEACIQALERNDASESALSAYPQAFQSSRAMDEIYQARNFYQALAKPAPLKFIHLGAQYLTAGKGIRDRMMLREDCQQIEPLRQNISQPPAAPPANDSRLYPDRLTGVYLAKITHREDQPSHLLIHDPALCAGVCRAQYGNPCTRFCPGGVYEITTDEIGRNFRLKLNPANCLHCKTCDIKDPFRNIRWTCPEGGAGPGYTIA